jgi:V-type H+-transporting ATPase subunit a
LQCEEAKADEEEHADFSEVVIHQVIETIEYVLGTVSHTASYLRLWALSLAHQQLSFVFFQKTILSAMGSAFPLNVIMIFIMFAVWFMVTLGVLMGMDVLECVLHVLRLHWIEFNSKFYKADGYAFAPYRHKHIVESKDDGF